MHLVISETKEEGGRRAAEQGAALIREALSAQEEVTIIVATGVSQFEMLAHLVTLPDIAWDRVVAFHLDEYVGISSSHPASFQRYLQERFVAKLPQPLRAFHAIDGEGDPEAECRRVGGLLAGRAVAVAFVGIGENGHLAFNDPPADFETEASYLIVELDEACRRQQLGEGWFPTFEDVPQRAISMSIRQIMKAQALICTVPDARKAVAVQATVEGSVTPLVPASILQRHPAATLYLDPFSASLLKIGA